MGREEDIILGSAHRFFGKVRSVSLGGSQSFQKPEQVLTKFEGKQEFREKTIVENYLSNVSTRFPRR